MLDPIEDTSRSQPQAALEVGWKDGDAYQGCRAVLGIIHKHIHFMLLPEAISSRTVRDVGMNMLVITCQTHPLESRGSSLYVPLLNKQNIKPGETLQNTNKPFSFQPRLLHG